VSLLSRWYRRFRQLIHEGAKFGVIGAIGFAVTEAGFNLLHFDLGASLFTSNAVATLAGTVVTFLGNRYWTFRHRDGHGTTRESIMFFALNGVGLLIQYASVVFAEKVMGVPVSDKVTINIAYLIGIAVATLFRFWSYRKWVWFVPSAPPPGAAAAREPVTVPPTPRARPGLGTPNGSPAAHGAAGPTLGTANGSAAAPEAEATAPAGPRHARSRQTLR
jgi:putative flippase GtrA